jgi:hypothetical protein
MVRVFEHYALGKKTTTGLVQNLTREYFLTSGTEKHESLRYRVSTVVTDIKDCGLRNGEY